MENILREVSNPITKKDEDVTPYRGRIPLMILEQNVVENSFLTYFDAFRETKYRQVISLACWGKNRVAGFITHA